VNTQAQCWEVQDKRVPASSAAERYDQTRQIFVGRYAFSLCNIQALAISKAMYIAFTTDQLVGWDNSIVRERRPASYARKKSIPMLPENVWQSSAPRESPHYLLSTHVHVRFSSRLFLSGRFFFQCEMSSISEAILLAWNAPLRCHCNLHSIPTYHSQFLEDSRQGRR
jgi:hypothetical protein